MKIIKRNGMGGTTKRRETNYIGLHHSATNEGSTSAFERHWRNVRGWQNGGYSEVVLRNGDVEINYEPDVQTNGILHHNHETYHICYVGNGDPTPAQMDSLKKRIKHNLDHFGLSIDDVKGHKELQPSICPGIDMDDFRKSLETSDSDLLRVQLGAFSKKENAESFLTDVQKDFSDAFIVKVDGLHKVQIGAFANSDNAKRAEEQAKSKGYDVYVEGKEPNEVVEHVPVLEVDGVWGPQTTKQAQKVLGTVKDGVISRQRRNDVTRSIAGVEFANSGNSPFARALQRHEGASVDGLLGPQTIRSLQSHLGTPVDGVISNPSMMVEEMQNRLNRGDL